jgi:hypothetical protein
VQFKYSSQLITETIQCFKEENNIELSPEQANDYLNNLGGLYLAFAGGGARPASLEADGTPPQKVDNHGDAVLGVSNT